MSNATVLKYQTLFDVSTQETGSIDAAFAIALANGLSVTDVVEPGSIVLIPETLTIDAKTVDYFLARQIKPASDNVSQTFEPLNWGAYWVAQSTTSATGKVSAMKGQTLFDIAVQQTGSAENALAIAIANGLSLSAVLEAGTDIEMPSTLKADAKVVNYLAGKGIKPASDADENNTEVPLLEGIGYWAIGVDFIIS